jgi:hypothetical protein
MKKIITGNLYGQQSQTMRLWVIAVCLLFSSVTSADDGKFTGKELYDALESEFRNNGSLLGDSFAQGFIMGVAFIAADIDIVCPAAGTKTGQIYKIVHNYLDKHPESWNESAKSQVVLAIREAWPCAKDSIR